MLDTSDLTQLQFSSAQRAVVEIPSPLTRETMGRLFDITPLNSPDNSGIHQSRHWYAEKCIFTQVRSDAFAVRRTKAQATNGEHLVFVHRYVRGYLRGRANDLNIDREPGHIYILDQASSVECVQRPATMQCIFIPKSALGFDPDQHPPLTGFSIAHGLGRVLNTLFDQIFEGLLTRDYVEYATFNQLLACLKLGLGADPHEGDIRNQARNAIRKSITRYVEQNVSHWDLSVDTILQNFGVSRAGLYRMFEDRGGVRQFISDRRLLHAVLDISNGPLQRGEIAAAAEKWGYSSAANFNRAIQREFGVAPGSLLNLPDDEVSALTAMKNARDFKALADESIERITQSDYLVAS